MNDRITATDNFDNLRTLLAATTPGDWRIIVAAHNELPALLARLDEVTAENDEYRKREWRNMPDDEPTRYKGHPQPGAAPHHYGPDDVVVDGDWLEAVTAEKDALAAVIADALAEDERLHPDRREGGTLMYRILSTAPSSVLASHDAKVRAEALREAADGLKAGHGSMVHVVHAAGYLRTRADKEENR